MPIWPAFTIATRARWSVSHLRHLRDGWRSFDSQHRTAPNNHRQEGGFRPTKWVIEITGTCSHCRRGMTPTKDEFLARLSARVDLTEHRFAEFLTARSILTGHIDGAGECAAIAVGARQFIAPIGGVADPGEPRSVSRAAVVASRTREAAEIAALTEGSADDEEAHIGVCGTCWAGATPPTAVATAFGNRDFCSL